MTQQIHHSVTLVNWPYQPKHSPSPDCDHTFTCPLVVAESVAIRTCADVTSWRVGALVLTPIRCLTFINVYQQNITSKYHIVPIYNAPSFFRTAPPKNILQQAQVREVSTLPLSGVNSRFFSAIPLSRFSLKMSRLFCVFRVGKMRSMSSAQHKAELRRLGYQLPVLGKTNSLCKIVNVCPF